MNMSEINSINFNNINSNIDMNLVIERFPIIPSPTRNIYQVKVPGRNGSLTIDEGTYDNIEIPITFGFQTVDFLNEIINIKKWFCGTGGILKLSILPGVYFKVKSVSLPQFEEDVSTIQKFTAMFTCDPFKYRNEVKTTVTNINYKLNYSGTAEVKPLIKITGSGNITLTVNNANVILTSVDSYITLDGELEDAYKDTSLQNGKMNGEFPILKPGENIIDFIGSVTKIEITYREAFL